MACQCRARFFNKAFTSGCAAILKLRPKMNGSIRLFGFEQMGLRLLVQERSSLQKRKAEPGTGDAGFGFLFGKKSVSFLPQIDRRTQRRIRGQMSVPHSVASTPR